MENKEILDYYSRDDIQQAILDVSEDREVSVRYGSGGFGKRPDILQFKGDVKEFAKKGVTSFHISEERWIDPLQLQPGMSKKNLDPLRKGWDLILDIDTHFWDYAKYTAYLLIEALKFHDIKSIGLKFSGNKGFHICVPFEAFPDEVNGVKTKDLFPESLRVIAAYLQQMIKDRLTAYILEREEIEALAAKEEKKVEDLLEDGKFDPFKIVDIDTILISNRHLFRSPYSLHEKSGLISLPINPNDVLSFEKEMALPKNVNFNHNFLDRDSAEKNEAKDLIIQAFDWHSKLSLKKKQLEEKREEKEFEPPKVAIAEEFFPPCIQNILKGGMEDGRKRSVFVLIKFLRHMGWTWENVEKRIKEWNEKNVESLRENYILAQIHWHRRQKDNIMAPNCANVSYYKDLRICTPENLCSKIKNPINFALIKTRAYEQNMPKRKKKS